MPWFDKLTNQLSMTIFACTDPVVRQAHQPVRDYREILHPKRPDTVLKDLGLEKPYYQVFAQKYGFIPNLSIMDLLFNEGPDSILYLKAPGR